MNNKSNTSELKERANLELFRKNDTFLKQNINYLKEFCDNKCRFIEANRKFENRSYIIYNKDKDIFYDFQDEYLLYKNKTYKNINVKDIIKDLDTDYIGETDFKETYYFRGTYYMPGFMNKFKAYVGMKKIVSI